jgi:beta-glucanase (GH16 family)
VRGDAPNGLTFNLVSGDNAPGWNEGIDFASSATADFNSRTETHIYAFEWLPDSITWYLDGAVQRTASPTDTGSQPFPEKSTKIMMNLWALDTGPSSFGGDPAANAGHYPFSSRYDWIRFYKADVEDTYPCSPTPACLPVQDTDGAKNNPEDGVPDEDPSCASGACPSGG